MPLDKDLAMIWILEVLKEKDSPEQLQADRILFLKVIIYPALAVWGATAMIGGGVSSGQASYDNNRNKGGFDGFEE